MKKVCIVFDHPYTSEACYNEPHNRSFSAALLLEARTAYEKAGYQVDVIDLHMDEFDPVMHKEDLINWRKQEVQDPLVKNYQQRILSTDELVFVFPIWWEAMPAMMKGFFNKVISKGIVYEQEGRIFKNNFEHLEKVKMVTTMSTPSWLYKLLFGSPITKMVFRGTFRKMGFNNLKWFNYSGMQEISLDKRQKELKTFSKKIIA